MDPAPAPIFRRHHPHQPPPPSSALPPSSPAFGTPMHPLKPFSVGAPKAAILPIILPPATLRPLAFRTFTKKHSLTLTSSALQELASFVGRHCGSGWRADGLAEPVLEDVARSWKKANGGVIVDGASKELQAILKTLEGNMGGGKIAAHGAGARFTLLPRGDSALDAQDGDATNTRLGLRPPPGLATQDSSSTSFGLSGLGVQDDAGEETELADPRAWLSVINAYEQPRLVYNVGKKHFERDSARATLFPPASHKTTAFRNRYHVIHQRLLRNELFQASSVSSSRRRGLQHSLSSTHQQQQSLKITPIANLLGRHGSSHMLLGQLIVLPTGNLAISDLTGSIALDLEQAVAIPEDSAWFCPGMVVLVDGVYEEEGESVGRGLSGSSGVGGTLGGRFQGFFIGQPPCEKRKATLGISGLDGGPDHTIGGGFGWIDFLGVGSERATGAKMRRVEHRLLPRARPVAGGDGHAPAVRDRVVIVGELQLDQPRTMRALGKILSLYEGEPEGGAPLTFVLTGNFTQHAVMARGGGGSGSIAYKEYFDALAAVLSDFPSLLRSATFVFVPGDNDGWVSAFTAGASVPLPRKPVPEMFTSRVRRAFASANAGLSGGGSQVPGSAVWTSNPSRLTLFGPNHELVLFRDDLSARLRRTSVNLGRQTAPCADHNGDARIDAADAHSTRSQDLSPHSPRPPSPSLSPPSATTSPRDLHAAQKLVKTLLDQGYLSPFRQPIRPVHWDYASTLHLYPLPTALALVDTTAPPFCITYEGCHVMNPGPVLVPGRRGLARWVEYRVGGSGMLRECVF